ncbi:hypothetical protein Ddye_007565 [Dipteronia dyeriana]|uniref:Uncharacterized protein n=1 Tax=Dipteronia dyeriana TaxID=168575 RepID=A0AAE0CRR7_9ROSI|nr:hypothetical protein Ddye_007565 [Dipteronia dyeriana]
MVVINLLNRRQKWWASFCSKGPKKHKRKAPTICWTMELVILAPSKVNWSSMFSASLKDPAALATISFSASVSISISSWAMIFANFSVTSMSLSFGKQNFRHLDDTILGMVVASSVIRTNTKVEP